MTKTLGTAVYRAYRENGVLHVSAEGSKPYVQTKVSIEQLLILIYPPRLALFFDTPTIANPAITPFVIEKAFASYPKAAHSIAILDATGLHNINIEDRGTQPQPPTKSDGPFCVFQQIGMPNFVVAKCDAFLPAIYYKVFGPATHDECEQYVAAHIVPAKLVKVDKGSFKAWINKQPPGPHKLIVTGSVEAKKDTVLELVPAVPQGINPAILLLDLDIVSSTLTRLPNEVKPVRYEETPPKHEYTNVTIKCEGDAFSIPVAIVS